MKYFISYLIFFVIISGLIFSQDNHNTYSLEQVRTFKNTKGVDALLARDIEGYAGVSAVSFVEGSGQIMLYDILQNRLVSLDSEFNISSPIDYPPTSHVYKFSDYFLSYNQDTGFEICGLDGQSI